MFDEMDRLPPDFSGVLPLFPSADVMFFPNYARQVEVTSSPYLEIIEESMNAGHLIAMATLQPGGGRGQQGRPELAPTVCITEVAICHKTSAGGYRPMMTGLRRGKIVEEVEPLRTFRQAQVVVLEDATSALGRTQSRIGRQLASQLKVGLPSGDDLEGAYRRGELSLSSLTDIVACLLSLPVETKLQLLAETDVIARAQTLIACLTTPTGGEG